MNYDEEPYTTEYVADKLNLSSRAIRKRCISLGIEAERIGRSLIYTEDQFFQIENYERKKCKIDIKIHFAVIKLFLSMNENSVRNISEATGISKATVNYVINEYLKNKRTIIVESKMNYL